ncbi:MAG: phenylalanine--tRNA ligase subunit beta, partial [Candidatus Omnitrophica bacterium]|nr:phenylalanine--tRNA ligase subunit beta [Candidatus Omnitrophota bacterium]
MKASLSWLKDYVDIKLPADNLANILTMAGIPAEHVEKVGNDWCLEFEITANRSDCLSIIGIAREIAAITGKKLKLPKDLKRMAGKKALSSQRLQINIKDKKLCPRYTGRIITGIKVVPSPKWMQEKLVSVGLRPVNNIVDITNFLLMETGQPMHAFDLDKIKGNIEIRKALKGETIKTIDGINQTLEEGMLLIADDKSPIAVAGVMGGIDTEVSRETKNILLESAYFDPISVRRTSRKLKLASESSYRFERKVDFEMVMPASDRAALMINTLAGGKIGKLIDSGSKAVSPISIKFNPEKANVLLGLDIPLKKQKDILKSLDFGVQGKKNILKVKVPSFRRDISQEVDITEEIVRIYGYDKISLTIPKMVGHSKLTDKSDIVKAEIRKYLSSMGLNEIITYNLISEEMLKGFSTGESSIVRLVNPLSREQGILTESLIPGILK